LGCGLRLAEVARAEDEAADDVSTVVSCHVPDVDDGAAGPRSGEVVDVAGEVVGLVGALVVEPLVTGGADDLGGEHAPHLPPLVAVGGHYGGHVASAECLGGEGQRPGGEVGVLHLEHLACDVGAGDGDDVDAA